MTPPKSVSSPGEVGGGEEAHLGQLPLLLVPGKGPSPRVTGNRVESAHFFVVEAACLGKSDPKIKHSPSGFRGFAMG
jgi:hypothetical protein